MRVIVTGGAGFIGSNLVAGLVERGDDVTVIDNFSTGHREFLERSLPSGRLRVEPLDLLDDAPRIASVIEGADAVVHLAANADVRFGLDSPRRDLEQNVIVTHNVLEAMRRPACPSSSSRRPARSTVRPRSSRRRKTRRSRARPRSTARRRWPRRASSRRTPRASACARRCTGSCRSSAPSYTHGHVIDFVAQLTDHPGSSAHPRRRGAAQELPRRRRLRRGDHVPARHGRRASTIFNLGVDDYCTVNDSVGWICERLGVEPERTYGGGDRGWVGDNPFIFLDTEKIRATGWEPQWTIREAVERTVDYLVANPGIVEGLERR